MTMIERVAAAIRSALEAHKGEWVSGGYGENGICLDGDFSLDAIARAAIAAMREPTTEMVDGWRRTPDAAGMTYDEAFRRYWWPAAIDAALSEK